MRPARFHSINKLFDGKQFHRTVRYRAFSTSSPETGVSAPSDSSSPQANAPTESTPTNDSLAVTSAPLTKSFEGPQRRRAILEHAPNIPLEQLPYQCFQEARKILQADREEKIAQIHQMRGRITRLLGQDPAISGGEDAKQLRLLSMRRHLEELKIRADINDPMVKKRYEDGNGDMNKPIYRYLADQEWRSYKRRLILQRISQMHIVPDFLPTLDPVVDVRLSFGRRKAQPGDIVDSRISEFPPKLTLQVFDKGERFFSIAVIDPDVPNVDSDEYDYRCHFLACNIPMTPTSPAVQLRKLSHNDHILLPWLPPFAQKGSGCHRLPIFVLQQTQGKVENVSSLRENSRRDRFILRSFIDKNGLKPVGFNIFRTQWDEGTAEIMKRAGIEGADIEYRRKRIEPLPYKKKDSARYR